MATGPSGPSSPGTEVDRICLDEIVRDGVIVVRRGPDGHLALRLKCVPEVGLTAGIAHYDHYGWRFFVGPRDGSPPLLLARVILREAPEDARLLTDEETLASSVWTAIVQRVEDLWRVADIMMT